MRQTTGTRRSPGERIVKDIKRADYDEPIRFTHKISLLGNYRHYENEIHMKFRVVRPQALTTNEIALWQQYLDLSPSLKSPFFSPQFTFANAAVRDDVHVGLCESGGVVVAFLPFHKRSLGVGKPVGCALSDYHGVIARPGFECDPRLFLRGCGLRVFDFNHLPASQKSFFTFAHSTSNSPYLDLSKGYESYLAERKKFGTKQISNTLRHRRKLEREVGPVRFVFHDTSPEAFQAMLDWKSAQYTRTGAVHVFNRQWTVEVLKKIMTYNEADFSFHLPTLYVGDQIAAVQFGMRTRSVCHWWFPTYNQELSKYSPGLILLLEIAKHAEQEGIQMIDLGRGDARYKTGFASDYIVLGEGAVTLFSIAGLIRTVRVAIVKTWERLPMGAMSNWPRRLYNRVQFYLDLRA